MPNQRRTGMLGAVALSIGLMLGGGVAEAGGHKEIIILDGNTNQPIQMTGLSDEALATLSRGGEVVANTGAGRIVLRGEVYRPGIWTDPDGCQHWVMDDGIEGFMAPILTREGRPICNGAPVQMEERMVIRKYDVPYQGKWKGN